MKVGTKSLLFGVHQVFIHPLWATKREQGANKRTTRTITHNNVTKCIAEWADQLGCHRQTLRYRLEAGWSHDRTITTPIIPGGMKCLN